MLQQILIYLGRPGFFVYRYLRDHAFMTSTVKKSADKKRRKSRFPEKANPVNIEKFPIEVLNQSQRKTLNPIPVMLHHEHTVPLTVEDHLFMFLNG